MKYVWLLIYGLATLGYGDAAYKAWAWTESVDDTYTRFMWFAACALVTLLLFRDFLRKLGECLSRDGRV